ncbi:MAG: L,D-transpeptidase family protein [Caldilineales bacterium]|nr:L,D-transpeptidase family protein [Caldilineales bacterium]
MKLKRWSLVFLIGLVALATWSPRPALASAPAGATLAAPVPQGGGVHIVRRGETLSGIARRFGVSVQALAAANGIGNINRIRLGQRLVIPGRGAAPAPAPAPSGGRAGKWIEIDLSAQRLLAHQGNAIVLSTRVSTGLPRTPTPVGTYRIRTKIRSQTMSGPGYRLPNVQWVQYFVGSYALHGTYWHHNFGHPMSHGCVNLTNKDARFLYEWAAYGTPVVVHR